MPIHAHICRYACMPICPYAREKEAKDVVTFTFSSLVQAGEGAGGGRQHPGEQRWDHGKVFIIVLSLYCVLIFFFF